MSVVQVTVKWNGKTFENVPIEAISPPAVFKNHLASLTGVPPNRQKIMGFKGGLLKDDSDWTAVGLREGMKLIMLGITPDKALPASNGRDAAVTLEDARRLPVDLASNTASFNNDAEHAPRGLMNLGTTCYLNAIIQFLQPVKEVTDLIKRLPGGFDSPSSELKLCAALRELYSGRELTNIAVPPMLVVELLRTTYPQFAEQNPTTGTYLQQDAEECLNVVWSLLNKHGGENPIDKMMGFTFQAKSECLDNPDEAPSISMEEARVLPVFCGTPSAPINLLHQGVMVGLEPQVEKLSPSLNRLATYKRVLRMASLPQYLVVHFIRFAWKGASSLAQTGATRSKICRRIAYSNRLDVFDFASLHLQKQLKLGRRVEANRSGVIPRASSSDGAASSKQAENNDTVASPEASATISTSAESNPTAPAPVATSADSTRTNDIERAADVSGDQTSTTTTGATVPEDSSPAEPFGSTLLDTGFYDLLSVVTHQGRTADGGHYIAWVKKDNTMWWQCDDEKISYFPSNDLNLAGGRADYHIAVLLLYKKSTIQAKAEEVGAARLALEIEATAMQNATATVTDSGAAAPAGSSPVDTL